MTWSKKRFEWKDQVNDSDHLSSSAKYLACFLCDKYVNRDTGKCWPSNKTLAAKHKKSTRSIQRSLKELREGGWLTTVKQRGRRRTLQLVLPYRKNTLDERDTQHDRHVSANATKMASKHDKTVVPYKNQVINQKKGHPLYVAMGCILVGKDEHQSLSEWLAYFSASSVQNPDALMEMLRRGDQYVLPTRYPKSDQESAETYQLFFAQVEQSNGCWPS
jgi:hypothetical protein